MKNLYLLKFFYIVVIFNFQKTLGYDAKAFDDTVLFRLDWPGNLDMKFNEDKYEPMIVTTPNQEKYKCMIPQISSVEEDNRSVDTNLSPLHFLSPIFSSSSSCSYRMEAYWHYEICHGRHVKQYHEDREGKNIKVQEYYLGKWDTQKMEKLKEKLKEDHENGRKFKTTKIDNIRYPYLEMEMSDGTLCDLNNEPRVTRVRYVCYPNVKNEIYSLKETSTCNYEAVVLTPVLCMHPAFLPEDSNENVISCMPIDGSPDKPVSWLMNEIDNLKIRYKQVSDVGIKKIPENTVLIKIDPEDGTVRMELIHSDIFDKTPSNIESSLDSNEDISPANPSSSLLASSSIPNVNFESKMLKLSSSPKDTSLVNEFLDGKSCLTGGTGWWKFDFCYGRHVRQFHVDKTGETLIILGHFSKEEHKNWLKLNPSKRPKPIEKRTEISHFYHSGTVCDKTGKNRQVEVKLKCLADTASLTKVSMYLLEPKTCQYILIVESPLICDILKLADEDGLITKEPPKESTKDSKPVESVFIGNVPVEDVEVRFEND